MLSTLHVQPTWLEEVRTALVQDEEAQEARRQIAQGTEEWEERDGLLLYIHTLMHVRKALFDENHVTPSAGHPGITRTVNLLQRQVYWKTLKRDVRDWVSVCDICQRTKPEHVKKGGLLQPLPTPLLPWEQVTLDFIVGLPKTQEGFDAMLVFTDKLSRMIHIAPTTTTCTAQEAADLFFKNIYKYHGLPGSIISDRDARFVSRFWNAVHSILQSKLFMSTAYHPETDGATERANQTIEAMLRAFVSNHQEQWADYVFVIEFACNNAVNASTGVSPFFFNRGLHPRTLTDVALPTHGRVQTAQDYLSSSSENG